MPIEDTPTSTFQPPGTPSKPASVRSPSPKPASMDWQPSSTPAEASSRIDPPKDETNPTTNGTGVVSANPLPSTPSATTAAANQWPVNNLPVSLPAPPLTTPDHEVPHVSPVVSTVPGPAPDQSGASSPSNLNYRPLNVKDALSYLEMVKLKFQDKPDVYNHFLDIMKDFKSQSIDTPGVIERVSNLFTGHPSLIQGFNTFLPQGYRIECSVEGSDNMITVTTPSGTTTQSADGTIRHISRIVSTPVTTPGVGMGPSGSFFPPVPPLGAPNQPIPSAPGTPFHGPPGVSDAGLHRIHSPHPGTPGVATLLGGLQPSGTPSQDPQDSKRPVEFNHAINYVNKIKNRFSSDPDTYKQFLEILQTYQKEQRPIRAVYDQVTILFNNASDLLEEFKQFLPDPSGNNPDEPSGGGLMGLMQASGPSEKVTRGTDKGKDRKGIPAGSDKEREQTKASSSTADKGGSHGKRKKRALEKEPVPPQTISQVPAKPTVPEPPVNSIPSAGPSKAKKSKHHHHNKPEPQSPPPYGGGSPQPGPTHVRSGGGHMHRTDSRTHVVHNANGAGEEHVFFDRVKKFIDDRRTYDEFLKLLHLFTEEIIDARTLIDRAAGFLGGEGSPLMVIFKDVIAWDERTPVDGEMGVVSSLRGTVAIVPTAERPRVDLNACRKYGPSYRKLPKHEVSLACSGRDAMCWEVLNDEWVSHPTWASEDAGFSTHKKNAYEDALHKSEEERHEYDFHVEAIIRTISVLEPINTRINMMDAEERAAFKLKPGLGGQGKSIYQRIIKKVYGRDHGLEVIQALHDSPSIAVPVVLSRLKQKEEEWKRAQREWNKVWREVDARNFYKSLDHQGINFKVNDKKSINPKQLILDIETKRREVDVERAKSIDPAYARTIPRHHFQFKVADDVGVLQDVLKLVFGFLDRASANSSMAADARPVEMFLRTFVPLFFQLDEDEFCAAFGGMGGSEDVRQGVAGGTDSDADVVMNGAEVDEDGMVVDGDEGATTPAGSSRGGKKKGAAGVAAGDLRKKLLKDAHTTAKGKKGGKKGGANTSRRESPGQSPAPEAMQVDVEDAASVLVSVNGTEKGKGRASAITAAMAGGSSNAPMVDNVWIRHGAHDEDVVMSGTQGSSGAFGKRVGRRGTFFANNTFYVLLRNLQLLYSRLHAAKQHAIELSGPSPLTSAVPLPQQPEDQARLPHAYLANPLAVSLGLADSTGPGASRLIPSGPNPAVMFYEHTLDCCEQLFEGEIDQGTFEDQLRFMFGIRAYTLFTIDKVVASVIKQVQAVLSDVKSKELLTLLRRERASEKPFSTQEQITARRTAEHTIGPDENMYRVTWLHDQHVMQIQLLAKDDPSTDDAETMSDRWRQYMASYVLGHQTEGLTEPVKAPFLRRNLLRLNNDSVIPVEEEKNAPAVPTPNGATTLASGTTNFTDEVNFRFGSKSGVAIKVCIRTYRMFFESGGEDWFYRKRSGGEERGLSSKAGTREQKRQEQWKTLYERKSKALLAPTPPPPGTSPVAVGENSSEDAVKEGGGEAVNGVVVEDVVMAV